MTKHILAIVLAFSSAEFFCNAACPLHGTDVEIAPSQDITQMNGTWNEYKKTTDFLTNETCITYDISCSNDTSCVVSLVQKKEKTISTITLTRNGTVIGWGDYKPFYINVDAETGLAILWDCNEENEKYELAVLMVNVSCGTTDVDELVNKINVTYKSELKSTDHTTCDATRSTINLAIIFLALSIITNT